MKVLLIFFLLVNMVAAILPPLDYRNYGAVLCVAVLAFLLGVRIEEERQ